MFATVLLVENQVDMTFGRICTNRAGKIIITYSIPSTEFDYDDLTPAYGTNETILLVLTALLALPVLDGSILTPFRVTDKFFFT